MKNALHWARLPVIWVDFYQFIWLQEKPWHIWCIILHCITGQSFKQILPYFGDFRPKKNTQRQPKIIFLVAWKLLKIENSGATKTNKRNLPDICTTWTAFNNRKLRVLIERWQGVHPNTHRKCLEFNSILTLRPFSISCKITIKVEIK